MALKEFDKLEDCINRLIDKNNALLKENNKLNKDRKILKEKIINMLKNIENNQKHAT